MTRLAVVLGLAFFVGGCVASEEFEPPTSSNDALESNDAQIAEDEKVLRAILKGSIADYEKRNGARLGEGWLGNITGSGDKCNVVHDRFTEIVDRLVRKMVTERGVAFKFHDMGTIVASGRLCEALSGHVYMALYRVDVKGQPTKVVTYFDPWRSESGFFATDPNVGAGEPEMWGIPKFIRP